MDIVVTTPKDRMEDAAPSQDDLAQAVEKLALGGE